MSGRNNLMCKYLLFTKTFPNTGKIKEEEEKQN